MGHRRKLTVWLLSALGLSLGARLLVADTPGNPYQEIADSNVFRLRPPPRQDFRPPPASWPRVTPTGITTILGDKRALLQLYFPARPPEPAKEVSCVLTVGQREGPVEVLEIDEAARSVKVNNSGTVMMLTLARDGPRLPGAPPPPAPPPLQIQSHEY